MPHTVAVIGEEVQKVDVEPGRRTFALPAPSRVGESKCCCLATAVPALPHRCFGIANSYTYTAVLPREVAAVETPPELKSRRLAEVLSFSRRESCWVEDHCLVAEALPVTAVPEPCPTHREACHEKLQPWNTTRIQPHSC